MIRIYLHDICNYAEILPEIYCKSFHHHFDLHPCQMSMCLSVGKLEKQTSSSPTARQIRVRKAEFGMKKFIVVRSVGSMVGRMFFNLNAWMIDGIFTSGPKNWYLNDMTD